VTPLVVVVFFLVLFLKVLLVFLLSRRVVVRVDDAGHASSLLPRFSFGSAAGAAPSPVRRRPLAVARVKVFVVLITVFFVSASSDTCDGEGNTV
jgi:hypothetical protein